MALPTAAEARAFYQSAKQRWLDARFLLEEGRTTGGVYLAGYAVECILKALILASIGKVSGRRMALASFRGAKAHDFGWLRTEYLDKGGPSFPSEIAKWFSRVNSWNTDLRYQPGTIKAREAAAMFEAAQGILEWAEGRL
ncbi:MAG: HEPN domain-containing protein [Gemmataceae bacterium]|nr:HEPN domain-containing protein [Gemmataceae bacterium]